ncbi:MAG: hypothetical protein OEM26_20995, partial [Saprospiraceae bacterium]|nr:hypothetical protein [Saprospiraceae bacterium]
MRNRLRLLLLISFFSTSFISKISSQQLAHRQGEYIVCLHPSSSVSDWVKKHTTYKDKATNLSPQKCLSDYLNIWKLRFDFTRIHEGHFLSELRNDPEVVVAQYNHLLKRRSKVPDDPFFSMQWQWL